MNKTQFRNFVAGVLIAAALAGCSGFGPKKEEAVIDPNAYPATYRSQIGDFEIASLQVNFNDITLADAQASMRLFGDTVLPRLPRL